MATTHPPINRERNHAGRPASPPLGPPSLLRAAARNRGRLALGVFIVTAFSLAAVALFSSAGERRPVLALRNTVAVGAPIRAADLTVVRVSVDPGVRIMPASDRAEVVGRVAGVTLHAGTLLSPAQLDAGPALAAGRAVVGLALKPGQYPPGLQAGDNVLVVVTPSANLAAPDGTTATDPSLLRSKVTSVEPRGPGDPAQIVSVEVAEQNVPGVLAAASAGRISLARSGATP
ncbi:MAG: SAF domain-containing protein [Actinomycetota bacterium]